MIPTLEGFTRGHKNNRANTTTPRLRDPVVCDCFCFPSPSFLGYDGGGALYASQKSLTLPAAQAPAACAATVTNRPASGVKLPEVNAFASVRAGFRVPP